MERHLRTHKEHVQKLVRITTKEYLGRYLEVDFIGGRKIPLLLGSRTMVALVQVIDDCTMVLESRKLGEKFFVQATEN